MRRCLVCNRLTEVAADDVLFPKGWRCDACEWSPASKDAVTLLAPGLADTRNGMDPTAFSALETIEEGHFWFEPRNRLITYFAQRFFPAARSYLEVGCGTGFVLRKMAALRDWRRLVGSELHPSGLRIAQQRVTKGGEWLQMDARSIPMREEFELLGCYDVLEHIAEDDAVLREAYAALRPGGGIILTVPQHPALWSAMDERAYHVRRYKRGELEKKLAAQGFSVLLSTSYTCILLPLMIASRMIQKIRTHDTGATRAIEVEARPPVAVNAILRSMLDLEVRLTMAGLRWPAGGSRVVVARRD